MSGWGLKTRRLMAYSLRCLIMHLLVPPDCYPSNFECLMSPKGAKVCSASGWRSSKRVPMEDLGNNRPPPPPPHPTCHKSQPKAWSVINDPLSCRHKRG